MVPVLHNAQSLSLGQMSATVKRMAKDAAGGTLSPDCLSGGTFTVSNLGAFGVTTFTPVINPPQVGILGVGKTVLRPVRVGNGIEHRDYMQFSLTLDHRVIDGAPGARFLQTLTAIVENFQLVCIAGRRRLTTKARRTRRKDGGTDGWITRQCSTEGQCRSGMCWLGDEPEAGKKEERSRRDGV